LNSFYEGKKLKLKKKATSVIPEHLTKTNFLPILEMLKRCVLLKINNVERHVYFFNTMISNDELLCHSSKSNSIPSAIDIKKDFFFKGLHIFPNFISKDMELKIMNEIDKHEFEVLKHRKVQHFGYKFIYGENSVTKEKKGFGYKVPDIFHSVLLHDNEYYKKSDTYMNKIRPMFTKKSISEPNLTNKSPEETIFNQFTVNLYKPGNGIPPHVDSHAPFLEPVVSLSLLSSVVITFKNLSGEEEKHVVLPARCLMVMTGEARYNWTHCIANRKMDRVDSKGTVFRELRVSLTYRGVKDEYKCECNFPKGCDYEQNILKHKNKS
jgi:alkylated DNA repair protein alkB family protein 8